MIKKIFLSYKSKPSQKSKSHGTYKQAKRIGLLYHADQYAPDELSLITDELLNDDKEVEKLGFTESEITKGDINQTYFGKKDISKTGKIDHRFVQSFINQPFDFLISLDTSENINYRYILASCKASCKIGLEAKSYLGHLQLSVKPSKDRVRSIMDVLKYLKMI